MKHVLWFLAVSVLAVTLSISPIVNAADSQAPGSSPFKLADATESWDSPEFGPVTLTYANLSGQQVAVTGSWSQPGGVGACAGTAPCIGQFKDGTYDRSSRSVALSYFQPWNNISGQASLTLSNDGKILTGTWQHSTGASGAWSMNRTAPSVLSESPAPPASAVHSSPGYWKLKQAARWTEQIWTDTDCKTEASGSAGSMSVTRRCTSRNTGLTSNFAGTMTWAWSTGAGQSLDELDPGQVVTVVATAKNAGDAYSPIGGPFRMELADLKPGSSWVNAIDITGVNAPVGKSDTATGTLKVPAGPYFPNTNTMSLRALGYFIGAVDRIYEWVPVTGTAVPTEPNNPPAPDDRMDQEIRVTLSGPTEATAGTPIRYVVTATNTGKLAIGSVYLRIYLRNGSISSFQAPQGWTCESIQDPGGIVLPVPDPFLTVEGAVSAFKFVQCGPGALNPGQNASLQVDVEVARRTSSDSKGRVCVHTELHLRTAR